MRIKRIFFILVVFMSLFSNITCFAYDGLQIQFIPMDSVEPAANSIGEYGGIDYDAMAGSNEAAMESKEDMEAAGLLGGEEEGEEEEEQEEEKKKKSSSSVCKCPLWLKRLPILIDLYSLNNLDPNAVWRPRYDDIWIDIVGVGEWRNGIDDVATNNFDSSYTEIDKDDLITSRALEILGYDALAELETISPQGNFTRRVIKKDQVSSYKVTAPYFIMNIYKALGEDIYEFGVKWKPHCCVGVGVTRSNPELYWNKFLKDHPINYDVYNESNIESVEVSETITGIDAIMILAQMLDYYGEPVISKQEENMLLQVYSADIPTYFTDSQKIAWSYLKCRGIIGEEEIDYSAKLTLEDMLDLLMRVKDKDSRYNFKEVQITTNLDDSFIENGYYVNETKIAYQPEITPSKVEVNFGSASRIDFLIEINQNIMFKKPTTSYMDNSLFISYEQTYNSKPIKGSIYHGVVQNKYYHFTVPRSALTGGKLYINSTIGGSYPLNYELQNSSGGVYTNFTYNDGYVKYATRKSFQEAMPDSPYMDTSNRSKTVFADSSMDTVTATYSEEFIDFDATAAKVGAYPNIGAIKREGDKVIVTVPKSALGDKDDSLVSAMARFVEPKKEFKQESSYTVRTILGFTGEKLRLSLNTLYDIGVITGYDLDIDNETLFIYTMDRDIVIVNNKNKTIQKGNSYMRVNETCPLFEQKDGDFYVDFKAIYGSRNAGFSITTDTSNGQPVVKLYDNSGIIDIGYKLPVVVHNMNKYQYYNTTSKLVYSDYTFPIIHGSVDLLYETDNVVPNTERLSNSKEVLLPFSSSNPFGNYLMYYEYNVAEAVVDTYLVTATPKGTMSEVKQDKDYKTMFIHQPAGLNESNYDIHVRRLYEKDLGTEIVAIPSIGYCYKLPIISSDSQLRSNFNDYLNGRISLPFAIKLTREDASLCNMNYAYYNGTHYKDMTLPSSGESISDAIPAPTALQTWFTKSSFVPTIGIDSFKGNGEDPRVYWGTHEVKLSDTDKDTVKITLASLNLDLKYAKGDILLQTMNRLEKHRYPQDKPESDKNAYQYPGFYSLLSKNLSTTTSEVSNEEGAIDINKLEVALQEFFNQFDGITLREAINQFDKGITMAYYIATRIIPLIIFTLLFVMLMLISVSDIRVFRLFCNKVFDPIKVLTFGNYTVETVSIRFFIVRIIIALTVMGMIQLGNLEKIIIWVLKWISVFMDIIS